MNRNSLGIKLDKLFIIDNKSGKIVASFNIPAKLYTMLSKLKAPTLRKIKEKFERAGIHFPFSDFALNKFYEADNPERYKFNLKRIR